MDHTEGTYAAAELLHALFERVVLIVTPRDSIADLHLARDAPGHAAAHQRKARPHAGARRTAHRRGLLERGRLAYVNLYNGDIAHINDVAFLAWSTPRAPNDALHVPLRAAGIEVQRVGDCKCARDVLSATAEGYAAGNTL